MDWKPLEISEIEPERAEGRLRICRALVEERRLVEKAFGVMLCTNPNWDMLIDLYIAEGEGRSVYQSALCLAAHVPQSSAHRWTANLAANGVLTRRLDDKDRRRIIVSLAPGTRNALDEVMDQLMRWAKSG